MDENHLCNESSMVHLVSIDFLSDKKNYLVSFPSCRESEGSTILHNWRFKCTQYNKVQQQKLSLLLMRNSNHALKWKIADRFPGCHLAIKYEKKLGDRMIKQLFNSVIIVICQGLAYQLFPLVFGK